MKICVIGLGYIGLPTSLLLAKAGHIVTGVDINESIIDKLKNDVLPFEEPGLENLFIMAKPNFTPQGVVEESDVFIIAVPTPLDKEMKMADLNAVKSAAEAISSVIKENDLVILESTVPPGTSEHFIIPIIKKSGVNRFNYCHCPERAIPGKTLEEMVNNERIIGGIDDESLEKCIDIYRSFAKGSIHQTQVTTAEFVKLMENTYRDINIALANEFALISEDIGINAWEAIKLANLHPRVDILNPGPGVGGHCIAIDPWFMIEKSGKSRIINLAREINDFMPGHVVRTAMEMVKGIENPVFTLFGLAYKGNVDDIRESPSLKIIKIAESENIDVRIYDPIVKEYLGNISDLDNSTEDCDCIILATDHDEFKTLDPSRLNVRTKNVLDTRNILDQTKWRNAGFNVRILGSVN